MKFRTQSRALVLIGTFVLVAAVVIPSAGPLFGQQITPPEEFFGFQLGSDRKIARWDKIVAYFGMLERQSGKIRVQNLGPSTEGNPFLLVLISSEENLANLDRLKEVNSKIVDPRGIEEETIKDLIGEGKAVICQSMSLHATEIGGTQMAPELAYDLLSRSDGETKRILSNVIFVMIPCFNPDGQIMVTDWYNKNLGTEFEGMGLPWLYHKYVGHDNNRDGFMTNMVESKYAAKIMFRDWNPQAYIDHHHMGGYGPRLYVPPYSEPLRPHADPLIWREHSWYGAHIAYLLEQNEKPGILNAAQYPGWGHFGWHWITPFHNIAGMLTESASASLATPLYVHPEQLRGGARGFPEYEEQSNFPRPWEGGWWRLRDIVEQQKISAWALLDLAARHRETILNNAYLKGRRQSERGASGTPKSYVVPVGQHDPLTAVKLVNKLLVQGIEIHRAESDFSLNGVLYGAGSYVIPLAQPKMGLIKNLLGRTRYPDNTWTRGRDGSPLRPYDSTTHTMNEFMGVRVDPLDGVIQANLKELTAEVEVAGKTRGSGQQYVLDGKLNDSFRAVNLLLDGSATIKRATQQSQRLEAGDFVVSGSPELLNRVSGETGVDFGALSTEPGGLQEVQRARIGMYQRYWGGNMDEGWTRFLLEQFNFPYTSVMDEEIKKGDLKSRYDVFILPNDSTALITGDLSQGRGGRPTPVYPEEYRSGIGEEGIKSLQEFVKQGGVLVALGEATDFAIKKFDLKVRNVLADLSSKEFFCPGSTIRVKFENDHPLAYGMPDEGLVLFWNSPAFEIVPSGHNDRYETIVRYGTRDVLQSGWLIGEKHLFKKSGMVKAQYGEGSVILIGFRTQNRAQTHGTFKLLFNALLQ